MEDTIVVLFHILRIHLENLEGTWNLILLPKSKTDNVYNSKELLETTSSERSSKLQFKISIE